MILTHSTSEAKICHALEKGVRGYVLLGGSLQNLTDDLRSIHAGGVAMGPLVVSRMADWMKRQKLTRREEEILRYLPESEPYFPEDQVTDQPVRFMAAELIREHVLMHTHEEVPHAVSVLIEQFEEGPRLTRIAAAIFCERDGQKAILLGKGGQMLKKIGTAARLDIEKMVATKVFLELFVKIKVGWRDSRTFVEELDWRRQLQQIGGPPEEN